MANPGLKRTDVNNGHAIAFWCAGQGPPLVLLHGFTLDSRIWRRQLEDLSDQFMVVAWEAPGARASSDPPNPFTMADWAHCLAGFLDVMGIERAHILGMSWGGVLAQEFYRLYSTPAKAGALREPINGQSSSAAA
jgi:pimeloyl-ACP methyl ester carboxylesterase